MIETYFRSWYQKLFVDKVAAFAALKFSAIEITFFGTFLGILVPLCLFFSLKFLAIFFLLLSGYFDTLDGTVARIRKESSPIGSIFDIVSDRIVEFSAVFGLYLLYPDKSLYMILMLGSILLCITSFLVVGIFTENSSGKKSFFYSVGLIERAEAFIFFIAMILCPKLFSELALLFAFLVVFSAYNHINNFIVYYKTCSVESSLDI